MDVLITPGAQREFDKLPTLVKTRLLKVFERLKQWPRVAGAKALKGPHAGQFRMRAGDYRVQFRVEPGRVIIGKVGHREGFYDG
jgi:mRNA-degrading endonuclease RelE of RelBE toxin-antitoxin system